MRKVIRVLRVMLLILMIISAGGFLYIKNMELPVVNIGDVQLGGIADGSYAGEYSSGLVSAAVTVKVKNKMITDIIINKHENGLGKKAEKIVNDIIERQSLSVDNISGATLSSNVIRKAVEQALVKQSIGNN